MTGEWLEADGTGGFASGTADLARTRRYHALLLSQTPAGRIVLVNGIEAWVDLPTGPAALSSQVYAPGVTHPDGASRITAFATAPWPSWTFALPGDGTLIQEVFVAGGQTSLRWTYAGPGPATLHVRPLISGRDYHALHRENPAFDFTPEMGQGFVRFRPYPGIPPITLHGGTWQQAPDWFRSFLYAEERARGLDDTEDLASPGTLSWDLGRPATLALRADTALAWPVPVFARAEAAERANAPGLQHATRQYLAQAGARSTVLAGFPWFTDWGRDTFISMRGLLLTEPSSAGQEPGKGPPARTAGVAQARRDANRQGAERILLAWSTALDAGMLPNRFPDTGAAPEFNSVDASLWFVIAVHDLLRAGTAQPVTQPVAQSTARTLQAACLAILDAYRHGTRYGIGMDTDALIHAGADGEQLTWMDAKVGDWVVTPRRGKPVEVQALWINALRIAAAWPGGGEWAALADQATTSLLARFPDPATGGLLDLVDGDDAESRRLRPNQIFACGGLPHTVVAPTQARQIVDLVESRLLTPLGLRTLDPSDPGYQPRYRGGPRERDGAYHQGTAWPWLLGPFVDAWLRTRPDTPASRAEARTRFLAPLEAHLGEAGLGHVSEVADGAAPHTPGGCPFQAWSLGEFLRIDAMTSASAACWNGQG